MDWTARIVTRTTGTTAARFADAVAARHAGDPAAWLRCSVRTAGTARVVVRRRRIVVAGAPVTFSIAPRIELRLATSTAGTNDVQRSADERVARITREQPRTVSAASAAPMLQRAGRRTVRDDTQGSDPSTRVRRDLSSRPAARADAMPADAALGPPPRVLRRRAAAAAPPPAPQRDEPVVRATVQPARPVPLSAVEISRLTDHIVQTIDRRIAAFRERQGRV